MRSRDVQGEGTNNNYDLSEQDSLVNKVNSLLKHSTGVESF